MTPFLIQREKGMREKYLKLQNGIIISGLVEVFPGKTGGNTGVCNENLRIN